MLFFAVVYGIPAPMVLFVILVILTCVPVDIVLLKKMGQARNYRVSEFEALLLTEQMERQAQYNLKLKEDMAKIGRIRDEAVKELKRVSELSGMTSNSIDDNQNRIMPSAIRCFCDNSAVDVLMNIKFDDCLASGISPHFKLEIPCVVPSVSDMELCVVLSNLVDNALNAAKKAVKERSTLQPFVKVSSYVQGNVLTISTQNSTHEDGLLRRLQRGKPSESKTFRSIEDHGWGLAIVEEIASRHGGILLTDKNNGVFTSSVVLLV